MSPDTNIFKLTSRNLQADENTLFIQWKGMFCLRDRTSIITKPLSAIVKKPLTNFKGTL